MLLFLTGLLSGAVSLELFGRHKQCYLCACTLPFSFEKFFRADRAWPESVDGGREGQPESRLLLQRQTMHAEIISVCVRGAVLNVKTPSRIAKTSWRALLPGIAPIPSPTRLPALALLRACVQPLCR